MATVTRADVLAFRWHAQQLDRDPGSAADTAVSATDTAILDLGVQDTGTDGAAWALVVRGMPAPWDRGGIRTDATGDAAPAVSPDVALAWTLRGAPHAYRRSDLPAVAVATAPYSESDAAKRVFDAARPLKAAGIGVLEALAVEAGHQRAIVREPTAKGALSTGLTARLDEPFLRWCRSCGATHSYEQTFRLATLQAGLELEPGTSPPVLRRIPGFRAHPYARLADEADPRLDVVRGYLRFFGPTTVQEAAAYLDAPVRDVRAHWPKDAEPVEVDGLGGERWLLAEDAPGLAGAGARRAGGSGGGHRDASAANRRGTPGGEASAVRLVGPFDPWLQLRDRDTLVADPDRARDLWRTLGRPGAVLADGEVIGTWRPRTSGARLSVATDPWVPWSPALRDAVAEQAERLAAFRGLTLRD